MASSGFVRFIFLVFLEFLRLGSLSIFTGFGGTCSQICAHLRIYVYFLAFWGFFCFFGISRRCSTFARHFIDVCSTSLEVARRSLDVCSTLLDVARCLLDVRFGFFAPLTGTEMPKQPKKGPKMPESARRRAKMHNFARECPNPTEYPKQPGNSRKQLQKHRTAQTVRKKGSRSSFSSIFHFLTFHFCPFSVFELWTFHFRY